MNRMLQSAGLASLAIALLATPAWSSPDTLRRSLGNIFQAPVDLALAPVTAGLTLVENLDTVSDNPVGKGAYAVFGGPGLLLLEAGTAVARMGTGLVELLPGVVLFPFDADLPPLFDREGSFPALLQANNPLAENPAWVKWVPFLTPLTIDLRAGVRSGFGIY